MASFAVRTSIRIPPRKSIPKFRPEIKRRTTELTPNRVEITKATLRKLRKGIAVFLGASRRSFMAIYIGRILGRLLVSHHETSNLEIVIAVNIDVIMPIDRVTANPLTGPEPSINNIIAAIKVVTFASIIVVSALL